MEATALKALICEDEGLTVMQWRRALQRAGFDVVGEAKEGAKGVELARELSPDVVLMDLNMPGMNGVEATRRIMEERPAPIVVLTAYSDDVTVNDALDAGASAYLVKPVVAEQLIPAVRAAMARFQEREAFRKEADTLKDVLETRKLVERAKGILMTRKGMQEDEAYKRIQRISRDRSQTMKKTATQIISAADLLK